MTWSKDSSNLMGQAVCLGDSNLRPFKDHSGRPRSVFVPVLLVGLSY